MPANLQTLVAKPPSSLAHSPRDQKSQTFSIGPTALMQTFALPPSVLRLRTPRSHPLPSPHRTPRQRPPLCSISREATVFSTGQRLLLYPIPLVTPPSTTRYVLCPVCHAAYIGNALTSSLQVQCAKCKNTFAASPASLFIAAPITQPQNPSPQQQLQQQQEIPDPTKVTCIHFPTCPGCTVNTRAIAPPILNRATTFLRSHLRHPATFASVSMGLVHMWRTHAKLAVRPGKDGFPQLGLFKSGTHDLVPIPQCAVHAPLINQAAAAVQYALRTAGVSAYNEYTSDGDVRYVVLTMARKERKVQVTLVWNTTSWKGSQPGSTKVAIVLWKGKHKSIIHSLWCNWNAGTGNVILHPDRARFYHMYGPIEINESIMDVEFYFAPYVFRQANLDAFEQLVLPKLLSYIPVGSSVAEFCAGVGVIGLVALRKKRLKYLVASEINILAESAFWKSYQAMRAEGGLDGVAEFVVGSDLDTMYIINDEIDIVIVDPPRAGLTAQFVEFLSSPKTRALRRVIYLSCGFQAFQNDSKILCAGEWRLRDAHAFVLFPGSDHVETLAIFDRVVKTPRKNVVRQATKPPKRLRSPSRKPNNK